MQEDYQLLKTCCYDLGNSHCKEGKYLKGAITAYLEAIETLDTLKAMNAVTDECYLHEKGKYYLNTAICCSNIDEHSDADYYFRRALNNFKYLLIKFPTSENCLMQLASCYYGLREYTCALDTLKLISSPSDNIHDAYNRLTAWCENKLAFRDTDYNIERHLRSGINAMQQIKSPTKDDLACLQIDINNLGELHSVMESSKEKDIAEKRLEVKLSKNKFSVFRVPNTIDSLSTVDYKKDDNEGLKQKSKR